MKHFYKTLLTFTLCLAGSSFVSAQDPSKPIALSGPDYAVKAFEKYVTGPAGYIIEAFEDNAPAVQDYKNYQAIIFLEHFRKENIREDAIWNVGDNLDVVREYVREGGNIWIIGAAFPRNSEGARDFRNLQFCDDLLGFSSHPNIDLYNPVSAQSAGETFFVMEGDMNFVAPYTGTIGKITSADLLASAPDSSGTEQPFATRNAFGEGYVFYFGTSPFRLARAEREKGNPPEEYVIPYGTILQNILKEH